MSVTDIPNFEQMTDLERLQLAEELVASIRDPDALPERLAHRLELETRWAEYERDQALRCPRVSLGSGSIIDARNHHRLSGRKCEPDLAVFHFSDSRRRQTVNRHVSEFDRFYVHPIRTEFPRLAFVSAATVGQQRGLFLPDQRQATVIPLDDALRVGRFRRLVVVFLAPGVGPDLRSSLEAELLQQTGQPFSIGVDLTFGAHRAPAIKARRDVRRRRFVDPGHRLQADERVEAPPTAVFGRNIQPPIAQVAQRLALRRALAFRPITQERADALESFNLSLARKRGVGVKRINVNRVRVFEFRKHLEQAIDSPLGAAGFPFPRVT